MRKFVNGVVLSLVIVCNIGIASAEMMQCGGDQVNNYITTINKPAVLKDQSLPRGIWVVATGNYIKSSDGSLIVPVHKLALRDSSGKFGFSYILQEFKTDKDGKIVTRMVNYDEYNCDSQISYHNILNEGYAPLGSFSGAVYDAVINNNFK